MAAVDLRSDTVSQPTASMRRAMAEAVVGDDVFGEDPTVNALEARTAELLGKQAALFVPSGTMANLIAVMLHCHERGSEMLCGDQSHIYLCEQGGTSQFGGVIVSALPNLADGSLDLDEVGRRTRRGAGDHEPTTVLLAVENTHNHCGGKPLSVEWMDSAGARCRQLGLRLHVDGARLWNASEALRVEPARLVSAADSVSVCFSKGLGAPVGSAVVGSIEFVKRARRLRKALGGGMRQAGVLAAAALVALDEQLPALYEDHRRAAHVAQQVQSLVRGVSVEANTNMVVVRVSRDAAPALAERLALVAAGEGGSAVVVRAFAVDSRRVRLAFHHDITDDHARAVATKLAYVLKEMAAQLTCDVRYVCIFNYKNTDNYSYSVSDDLSCYFTI